MDYRGDIAAMAASTVGCTDCGQFNMGLGGMTGLETGVYSAMAVNTRTAAADRMTRSTADQCTISTSQGCIGMTALTTVMNG